MYFKYVDSTLLKTDRYVEYHKTIAGVSFINQLQVKS